MILDVAGKCNLRFDASAAYTHPPPPPPDFTNGIFIRIGRYRAS